VTARRLGDHRAHNLRDSQGETAMRLGDHRAHNLRDSQEAGCDSQEAG
jgi:hypothetical protein